MARIGEGSEFFAKKEWSKFEKQLAMARKICRDLANKYGHRVYVDSRWPATGLWTKSLFKHECIRITLNPNYLTDANEFYELREHTVLSFSIFYTKILSDSVRAVYNTDQMNDKGLLQQHIEEMLSV